MRGDDAAVAPDLIAGPLERRRKNTEGAEASEGSTS